MKIEIWSDFVCPYCYIGKRQLDIALENFPHRDHVFIQFKSYELDPNAEVHYEETFHQLLAKKHQIPMSKAQQSNDRLKRQAADIGLTILFDDIQLTNTFDAHRLVKYAYRQGKGTKLAELLFHAYFTEAKHIGDHELLIELANDIGLSSTDTIEVLKTRKFSNAVREDIDIAIELNVEGVPFFVFNEKYALAGAQSPNIFQEVLNKVWEEDRARERMAHIRTEKTSYCSGDDYCEEDDPN